MANPEIPSKNIVEKTGYFFRNLGVLLFAGAIFAPQYLGAILGQSAVMALGGYGLKELSKK